jgi:hypothetical protein
VRVELEKKGLWLPPAKVDLFGNAIYTRKRRGAIAPPTNCPKSLMFASVYGENLTIHFFCARRVLLKLMAGSLAACVNLFQNLWNQTMEIYGIKKW